MTDRPTGAELLAEARRTLIEELFDLLPSERRYDGLMIANAMAIAARELTAGDAALSRRVAALRSLYGDGEHDSSADATLLRLERRLASEIREGVFDRAGERRDAVRAYLRAAVLDRLAVSNPKALPEADLS
jgi:hypothetical protein